jgi:hypothetical protein
MWLPWGCTLVTFPLSMAMGNHVKIILNAGNFEIDEENEKVIITST